MRPHNFPKGTWPDRTWVARRKISHAITTIYHPAMAANYARTAVANIAAHHMMVII
jgi:hypothetical protein